MSPSLSILCIVCAHDSPEAVPGRFLRVLAGLSLVMHTVAQAKQSGLFEAMAVSSSSAEVIARANVGIAGDGVVEAVRAAEAQLGKRFELVVALDAAVPLRAVEDIAGAMALQASSGATQVVSGMLAHRSPYFNLVEMDTSGAVRLSKTLPSAVVRRQDSPVCYDMTGAVTVWRRDALVVDPKLLSDDARIYVMPAERSLVVTYDMDFTLAELLMERARDGQ